MAKMRRPTKGAVWRKPREEGFVIELPSGHSARIRPVALDVLLRQGKVPDLLTPWIAKTIYEGVDTAELDKMLSVENLVEQSDEMLSLIDVICTAAFMEPCIVEEPKADDEIHITDVELGDRGAVFSLAVQPAQTLRSFLERQDTDLAAVPDGNGDGPAAE